MTRKEGIPAGMFWLDSSQVGWAGARTAPFKLLKMRLESGKPQRLGNETYDGVQEASDGGGGPWYAPDDVYYDAPSHTLLFSSGVSYSEDAYVRVLPLSSGKVRSLIVPHPGGLTYEEGGDVSEVTVCGSIRDPQKPVFYIAADIVSGASGNSQLWRSDSYTLRQSKVVVNTPDQSPRFPRLSPDGTTLAWLHSPGDGKPDQVVLYDLASGSRRPLVTLSPAWQDLPPAMGCPFSWSPDGKRIAYADGSKIKIVQVPADISGKTK